MLKKHGLALLIAVIVIQLCVPLGMVMSTVAVASQAEKHGTEYKIRVINIRYDKKHGAINYDLGYWLHDKYLTVSQGEDGFAVLSGSEKPENSSYLEGEELAYSYKYPAPRFYVGKLKNLNDLWLSDDPLEEDCMTPYNEFVAHYTEAYLDCYVYNGKISVKELYIDGVPAKEFIANIDTNVEATQPSRE